MTTLPNVDDNTSEEPYLALWHNRPNTAAERSIYGPVHDTFNIQVTYNDTEPSTLTFSTYKDSKGFDLLRDRNMEIVARIWDPRRANGGQWREPPNSRFIILESEEDMVDETNRIDFECISIVWLLEKVRVRVNDQFNTAYRLNRAEERARERYEEAERDYESEHRQLETVGRRIQKAIWPNSSHGPVFSSNGIAHLIRNGHAKYRSLVYNNNSGRVWWYSYDARGWKRINMNTGSDSLQRDKAEFRRLGPRVFSRRRRMNQRRSAYTAAQRANRNGSSNGTRFFYNMTPGRILRNLWHEGQRRDAGYVNHGEGVPGWDSSPYSLGWRTCKGLWREWTSTRDSRGRLWTRSQSRKNWELPLGSSMLNALQDFQEAGELDWKVGGPAPGGGGRSLIIVPHGSLEVNQTRRVIFRLGQDVEEAPETISSREHQTVTFVLDDTGLNRYVFQGRNRATQQTPWGLWEGAVNAPDGNTLNEAIRATREERHKRARRYQIDSSRRLIPRPTGPLPMLDYEPHHLVSVYSHEGPAETRKVNQIILEQNPGEPLKATVRFGTRHTSIATNYSKTMNKVLSGTDHIVGTIPMEPRLNPQDIPSDALYAPAITELAARVVIREDGQAEARLTATLAAHDVPEPEDAHLLDESEYGQSVITDIEDEGGV